ncbi:tetratricopeptide repeat-containing sensor histidine kinase [Spirosoma spitsbergense]|uniref:tetratricopeptide repeat-containing sensor histidine kinase n=1 Tax=Spirosoma spitsbergense TaxID=431554 RepID=UPI000363B9AA|nr:histidine kinase dimerization/phosphoacceptor domain -containing protein [Spirosoma spitsbergense]
MNLIIFALLFWFFGQLSWAQSPVYQIDSLREQLIRSKADTNRVKLLIDLSYRYVHRPGEKASDLNWALLFARQAITLSRSLQYYKGEGRGYLITAKALREKGDWQQGKAYAGRALFLFRKYDELAQLGHVYSELTRYYSNTALDVSSKINLNRQALSLFSQTGETKKEAELLKEQGDLLQLQENYRQSLKELQRALILYRSISHPDVDQVYDLLGFVSTKIGDYKAGLAYGLQAVKTAQLRGSTDLQLCTIYNRLGTTYQALGQSGSAHICFQKSLDIALIYKHAPSIIYISCNISSLLVRSGKPRKALVFLRKIAARYPPTDFESRIILATRFMDIYRSLHQYDRAQPYFEQVIKLTQEDGAGSPGRTSTYHSVIGFLLASGQYGSAQKYLTINHQLCLEQGSAIALADNHLQRFQLDSTLGRYPSAIVNFQRYVRLRDSLFTESKNHQIAQLEIQYQTAKRDQDLKLKEKNIQLLTEHGKLQQHRLDQAQLIRNGTLAGAFLLILVLGVGYNRYRLKQKSNQLLENKQLEINQKNNSLETVLYEKDTLLEEKEWMLKEIHHRVRNNLQIVMSLLNSQAAALQDKAALSAIQESQHRVQAMALIHQKLYQSEQISRVDMTSYINDMVDYLRDSYAQPRPVSFNLSIDLLALDVTQAVPLGLIINEAITNALKYAFPDGRSGTVSLSLHQVTSGTYELTVADDGVGLPVGYAPERSRSLGMSLMYGLCEQLGALLTVTSPPGVTISLLFTDERFIMTNKGDGDEIV